MEREREICSWSGVCGWIAQVVEHQRVKMDIWVQIPAQVQIVLLNPYR